MDYIILDLEWNQSNSGKEREAKLLPFEIIEIGAVRLDAGRRLSGQYNQLIRPQIYREMHRYTGQLIHLNMKELEKGAPFPQAVREFLEWCGKDFIFCTWGSMDLTELQRNMTFYGLAPFSDRPFPYLDVQKLFSIAYEDRKSRRSLEYAIDYLKIDKDIPFHRAFSDAYYTARILEKLEPAVLLNDSYDMFTLPAGRKEEIHVRFDTYAKYISREFEDKAAALEDKEVISTKCYLCNKNLHKKIRWFTPNGKHFYSVAWCDEHGYMKAKIRIRKTEGEKVCVVKTMKFIPEEELTAVRQIQDHARQQRKLHQHHKKRRA